MTPKNNPNISAANPIRGPDGRFLPGNVANPLGRPKKEVSLTSLAKAMLEARPDLAAEITETWLRQARKGQTEARRDLQDRIEGRVPLPIQAVVSQQIEVTFTIGRGYVKQGEVEEKQGAVPGGSDAAE